LDRDQLKNYLSALSQNAPNNSTWSEAQKLAYWINVYNAFTLDLILEHYPVASIKDIGSSIQIPFLNTPWDKKFILIGSEMYSLNEIEHNILRKLFKEPRIHFVINCASYSCPKLRNEAFEAEKLEHQLTDQAINFLSDTTKNVITPNHLKLSKIFQWYRFDFPSNLQEYIGSLTNTSIHAEVDIDYLPYDWGLNEKNDVELTP
jgi:hypothetical protein